MSETRSALLASSQDEPEPPTVPLPNAGPPVDSALPNANSAPRRRPRVLTCVGMVGLLVSAFAVGIGFAHTTWADPVRAWAYREIPRSSLPAPLLAALHSPARAAAVPKAVPAEAVKSLRGAEESENKEEEPAGVSIESLPAIKELAAAGDPKAMAELSARDPKNQTAEALIAVAVGRGVERGTQLQALRVELEANPELLEEKEIREKLKEYLADFRTAPAAAAASSPTTITRATTGVETARSIETAAETALSSIPPTR